LLAGVAGHLQPSTRDRYESIVSKHIEPRLGTTPLAKTQHADLADWISQIDLAPASVRYIHGVMSLILKLAVRDGRLQRNPAAGVRLPKPHQTEKQFLSKEQVFALADAAGDYRTSVLTLAYCGLRWGELAALKVGCVDLMRRRLTVAESATEVQGHLVWGTPKNHQHRSVSVPRFLADLLSDQIVGKAPTDLVFTTPQGNVLRNLNFRRDVFDPAAIDAGLEGLTPHELRHTAASLAVSVGANVKAVQRMLGHKSAAMTLDVYSGLFDGDLDAVADRLDATVPDVYPLCTEATVVDFPRQAT
jgi:integrase